MNIKDYTFKNLSSTLISSGPFKGYTYLFPHDTLIDDDLQVRNRLNIGRIVRCLDGEKYGVLLCQHYHLFRNYANVLFKDKRQTLFYFEKESSFVLDVDTFVTFAYDDRENRDFKYDRSYYFKNYKSHSIEYLAHEICPLDEYRVYRDFVPYYESEDYIKHVCNGEKFIVLGEYNNIELRYPCFDLKNKVICYLSWENHWSNVDNIINYYLLSHKRLDDFLYIEKHLKELRNYVDNFDLEKEIESYTVGEEGHYHCRPGRSDDYITIKYSRINSHDVYIRSLFPLEETEDIEDLGWSGARPGYNHLDEEAIANGKKECRLRYNKKDHYVALVNEFKNECFKDFELYNSIKSEYEEEYDTEEVYAFLYSEINFSDKRDIENKIITFNSHQKGKVDICEDQYYFPNS